jgi:hypothetical protein
MMMTDHLFPSSVMRVYKIALHVSALRPPSEAEQVLQDLLLHSAHVQRVFTRLFTHSFIHLFAKNPLKGHKTHQDIDIVQCHNIKYNYKRSKAKHYKVQ